MRCGIGVDSRTGGTTGRRRGRADRRNRGTSSACAHRQPRRDRHPHRQGGRRARAWSRSPCYPPVDERSLHTRLATRVPPDRRARRRRRRLPRRRGASSASAIATGCDCVHPGYGFLAENAAFAERCAAAGLTFVGPSPAALALFGDKVRARALARSLGIPVVAGSPDAVADGRGRGARSPREIGYPVMLKASAGGGGRGHARRRRARRARRGLRALPQRGRGGVRRRLAVRRAPRRPTAPHRGPDPRRRPRQRRPPLRPRLLGAAPQPEADRGRAGARARPGLREQLFAGAIALAAEPRATSTPARSSSSSSPETGEHFFIECNPRIQVEHTVTEQVTGIDLVEAQFRIAAGESLADIGLADQDAVGDPRGYAVQARVVATGAGELDGVQGAVGSGRARRRVRLRRLRPAAAVRSRCWPRSSASTNSSSVADAVDRTRRARRRAPHRRPADEPRPAPRHPRPTRGPRRRRPHDAARRGARAGHADDRRRRRPGPAGLAGARAARRPATATPDAAAIGRPASRRRSWPATTSTPCAARWAAR